MNTNIYREIFSNIKKIFSKTLGYIRGISYIYYVINDKHMKTLLEKINPSNMAILNEAAIKYPSSVSSLIKTLGNNYSWLELKYNDVIMLLCYLGVTDYGPNGVKSVFED